MLGVERRSLVLTEEERKLTAYHEAGHAIVRLKIPGSDPIHKVTIVPRGRALGLTASLPEVDRHNYTKDWLDRQPRHVLRRPGGRGDRLRRRQGHDRRGQRHRAGHRRSPAAW